MSVESENLSACRAYQQHYDEQLCRHVGIESPQPHAGEDILHYRARALNLFKRTFLPPAHEHHLGYHELARSDSNAFAIIERSMLQSCKVEAVNPAHVPPGQLRQITERDAYGQVTQVKFIGQEHFTKQMGRAGRRVVSFLFDRSALGR
jgi:hypothetical protein